MRCAIRWQACYAYCVLSTCTVYREMSVVILHGIAVRYALSAQSTASQEINIFAEPANPKVQYHIHKIPQSELILSYMHSFHIVMPCFCDIHFNIIFPFTPNSSKFHFFQSSYTKEPKIIVPLSLLIELVLVVCFTVMQFQQFTLFCSVTPFNLVIQRFRGTYCFHHNNFFMLYLFLV
jgi:hypothetical protein